MQHSIQKDISYGPHPLQRFDVYVAEPSAPVVFLIHGGGFILGRKEDFEIPARLFCEAGFTVVNLSHRLVDANWFSKTEQHSRDGIRIADQLADIDAAVRLFKKQAHEAGLFCGRLYIAGHSAGAILAMLYLLENGRNEGLRAAGNWAGITDLRLPTDVLGGFLQPWQQRQVQLFYERALDYTALAGTGDSSRVSPYWVAEQRGGRPVISLYPEHNVVLGMPGEALLGLMQTKRFHALLRSQHVPEQFSLYAGCDHSFRGCGDDAWRRCIEETAAFFNRL